MTRAAKELSRREPGREPGATCPTFFPSAAAENSNRVGAGGVLPRCRSIAAIRVPFPRLPACTRRQNKPGSCAFLQNLGYACPTVGRYEADLDQVSEPEIAGASGGYKRAGLGLRKADGRSAVTNGKRLFVDRLDGRGPWARRLRDIIALHVTDQG